VAGSETLVGMALVERLQLDGFTEMVGISPHDPNLTQADEVEEFFSAARPEYVFVAGGASGGILVNQRQPAELMRDNLLTAANILGAAHRYGTTKLLYLASSCIYPRLATQPMTETALWTGPPEPTSEFYSTAKLAGLKLCQAYRKQYGSRFIAGIAANAFGPRDDFKADTSHVIPALVRKFHWAALYGEPTCNVWGSGRARRDFIYANDLADACVFVMRYYDGREPINLGSGVDRSISEVAHAIAEVGCFRGKIVFDKNRPDGAPAKCLDITQLTELGWKPWTDFHTALSETWEWYNRCIICKKADHERVAV
jgi:GDP-L-fucose synthase